MYASMVHISMDMYVREHFSERLSLPTEFTHESSIHDCAHREELAASYLKEGEKDIMEII